MNVYLLTKNKLKLAAARSAFDDSGITLKILDKSYPEIQADTSLEVAMHTALQAAKENNCIVIREDQSFFIKSLHGFPGPYMRYFQDKIPAEKILELMHACADRSAYFKLAAVVAWPDGKYREYVCKVPLVISRECHGSGYGWDKIFMLEGDSKSFEEGNIQEDTSLWNKNYINIAKDLSGKIR